MKRLMAIILLSLVWVGLKAQVTLSADVSFSNSHYAITKGGLNAFDASLPEGWEFAAMPSVGYSFGDSFEIGLNLGYGQSRQTFTSGTYNSDRVEWQQTAVNTQRLRNIAVRLYARKQVCTWGQLSLHLELAGSYIIGLGTNELTEYKLMSVWGDMGETVETSRDVRMGEWRLEVVPVFEYPLSKHLCLDVYVNALALAFHNTTTTQYGEKSALNVDPIEESVTTTSNFDVGVRTLNTSLLSLGFSYSF